jgi:hypothetical protein
MADGEELSDLRDIERASIFFDQIERAWTRRIKGSLSTSGLKNGGQDSLMTAVDFEWRKVERSASSNPTGTGIKAGRNSLKIANYSNVDIATTINDDPNGNAQTYAVGDKIIPENAQYLDVSWKKDNGDAIDIWVRSSSGNATVFFRELA